ncbi:MAG: NAD(P)-dependent alcohol dehydrogenase [Gemmataceae bacterium]
MRAIELQKEWGIDSLTIVDRPELRPGHGQVLVKVKACSLNYRDLLVVKGLYNPRLQLPFTPFSDGVGEVVAVGEGVSRVNVGDRVAGIFMQKWIDGSIDDEKSKSALGGGGTGMLAEQVLLDQEGVVHVPTHLSDQEASTLPCAAVTAWHALVVSGGVKAGDTVLTLGTGGVSLFALQFAKLAGATVIATSSSDEKLAKAKRLGASELINYKSDPDWNKTIGVITNKVGVDHVVEVGGAGTLPKSLKAVRLGGHIALIGILSGGGAEFNPLPILMKNIRVQGIYVGSRQMFEDMNKAIAAHNLKPTLDKVFGFEEVPDALRYMETGSHFGKICVTFS